MIGGVQEAATAAALVLDSEAGKTFFGAGPVCEGDIAWYLRLLRGEVETALNSHPDRKQYTARTRGVMVVGTRVESGIQYDYCIHLAQEYPQDDGAHQARV